MVTPHLHLVALCVGAGVIVSAIAPTAVLPTYLLLDERNVLDAGGARLVYGPVQKDARNPVLREDKPWEMRFDNMQPNVYFDDAAGKWKAWYSSFSNCSDGRNKFCWDNASDCTQIGTDHGHSVPRGGVFCYAESDDGLTWTKPDLGLVEWPSGGGQKASTANNILVDVGYDSLTGGLGFGVYLDDTDTDTVGASSSASASASSPPGEKWKLTGEANADADLLLGVSADGLRFRTRAVGGTQGRFDSHKNAVFDPVTRRWIAYVRCDNTEGKLRVQCYVESDGEDYFGSNWSVARPTGLPTAHNYQPDALVAFPYAGLWLGFANVFNPFEESALPVMPGQVNMVLAWSDDARHWRYVLPLAADGYASNASFVPRRPGTSAANRTAAPDWDCCGVFGAKQLPSRFLRRDAASGVLLPSSRTLPLYYTGCNGRFFGPRACALGRAEIGAHAFAGMAGPATVRTVPVKVTSGTLRVTASGGVRVGVAESDELTPDACAVAVDGVEVGVTWKPKGKKGETYDLSKYAGGAVLLVFAVPRGAVLYAYHV